MKKMYIQPNVEATEVQATSLMQSQVLPEDKVLISVLLQVQELKVTKPIPRRGVRYMKKSFLRHPSL